MYADGLSFLEEEREAWRPFEALLDLSDEQLGAPLEGAHGWTGRDLMAHLCAWIGWWLEIARELAVNPTSPTLERLHELGRRLGGPGRSRKRRHPGRMGRPADRRTQAPIRTMPGGLRGYLTVVPEARWLKDGASLNSLTQNTTGHYEEHLAEPEGDPGRRPPLSAA